MVPTTRLITPYEGIWLVEFLSEQTKTCEMRNVNYACAMNYKCPAQEEA